MAGRADEVRTFKGTANSGKPFGYGGTQTVVDFEGLRHKASVPVLLEHSPLKMAGVCRLSVTADGLIAEGSLLSNEFGTQIYDQHTNRITGRAPDLAVTDLPLV